MPDALSTKAWPKITLAECAEEIAERVDNPAESGFERFVGLEHIETGDTAIRSWGSTDDVTSSMKVFGAGDVIVARRNVYLRRAARAGFDGVCSGDGIVLRANSEVCLPKLLPFLLNTASFWNYVTSQADGTMSKRITVKRLLSYEFVLPPIEEQQRIAEVLQASEGTADSIRVAARELRRTKSAMEIELIAKPLGLSRGSLHLMGAKPTGDWRLLTGQELLDQGFLLALQDGNHGSQYPRSSELGTEGLPYIAASDISDDGDIDLCQCKRILPDRASKLRIGPAIAGDVILTHNATVGRVTRLPDWPTDIVASTSTTYYRCDPALLDPEYLQWFFESAVFQFQLGTIMRQSTRNQVPITTQKRLFFAVPPLDQQQQLAGFRSQFLSARRAIRSRLENATGLTSAIVLAHL